MYVHVHTLFYLHGYSNRLHIDMAGFKVQCLVINSAWVDIHQIHQRIYLLNYLNLFVSKTAL